MKRYLPIFLLPLVLFSCQGTDSASEETRPKKSESQKKIKNDIKSEKNEVSDNLDFETVNFEQFQSRYMGLKNDTTYVINFWATWCVPCVEELPIFENLTKDLHAQKLKVILVSLDFPKVLDKTLIPFLKENKLQSKVVLLDDTKSNKWIPMVDEEWDGAIPFTLIYQGDKSKTISGKMTDEDCLQCEVKPFLIR